MTIGCVSFALVPDSGANANDWPFIGRDEFDMSCLRSTLNLLGHDIFTILIHYRVNIVLSKNVAAVCKAL